MRVEELLVRSALPRATVVRTGMGPRKAMASAAILRERAGEGLLVLGFCGGLNPDSAPGEVVIAQEVYAAADEGHELEPVVCADCTAIANALAAAGLDAQLGPVVSVSRLALGDRRAQLRAHGALAVDMESVWLAQGAAGRPFAVVRVVLDSPEHELLRPQAARGALRAARVLRRAAAALEGWPALEGNAADGPAAAAGSVTPPA